MASEHTFLTTKFHERNLLKRAHESAVSMLFSCRIVGARNLIPIEGGQKDSKWTLGFGASRVIRWDMRIQFSLLRESRKDDPVPWVSYEIAAFWSTVKPVESWVPTFPKWVVHSIINEPPGSFQVFDVMFPWPEARWPSYLSVLELECLRAKAKTSAALCGRSILLTTESILQTT